MRIFNHLGAISSASVTRATLTHFRSGFEHDLLVLLRDRADEFFDLRALLSLQMRQLTASVLPVPLVHLSLVRIRTSLLLAHRLVTAPKLGLVRRLRHV